MRQLPELFRGRLIVGAIKVTDDPSELLDKWIIMAQDYSDERSFSTHQIAWSEAAGEWVGINGRYDLPWSRAIENMAWRAREFGRPVGLVPAIVS